MSHLTALLPVLETLPGFPTAPTPSVLELLMVTVVLPSVIAAAIMLLSIGPHWWRTARSAR